MSHLSAALAHCLPELILAAGILVLVLFGALRGKESGGPVTEIAAGLLGLAIVMTIAVAHGGMATAVNRPEGGASVRLVLPKSIVDA